jgi:tRNA pseudouridine55 synthase
MENGIILIDKEVGMTSREVDNAIMKKFSSPHVGHLGTLDPFASGLLVLGLNKGTKYLPYLDDSKKSYIATLLLGEATSSGDTEGEKTEEKAVPALTKEGLTDLLKGFVGKGEQLPPMTSAIKINGEELYKKAHRGEVVERKPRTIVIYSLNLISFDKRSLVFSCTVSQGTYIRVLGEDIAKKIGTVGHLISLRRLSIGPFLVNEAKKLDAITEANVVDPTIFMTTMKHVEIDDEYLKKVLNGAPVPFSEDYGEKILVVLHGKPLAVYHKGPGNLYMCERGLEI